MCVYCEKRAQWGDYEVDNLSIREESKYNYGCYTGIQSFIDVDENELIMYAVVDVDQKPRVKTRITQTLLGIFGIILAISLVNIIIRLFA